MRKPKTIESKGRQKLGTHEISVRMYSDYNGQITMNQSLSDILFKHDLTFCTVIRSRHVNDIIIDFNKKEGARVSKGGMRKNVALVCSKYACGEILRYFKKDFGGYRLTISDNISKDADHYTIILSDCVETTIRQSVENVVKGISAISDVIKKKAKRGRPKKGTKRPGKQKPIAMKDDGPYYVVATKVNYEEYNKLTAIAHDRGIKKYDLFQGILREWLASYNLKLDEQ